MDAAPACADPVGPADIAWAPDPRVAEAAERETGRTGRGRGAAGAAPVVEAASLRAAHDPEEPAAGPGTSPLAESGAGRRGGVAIGIRWATALDGGAAIGALRPGRRGREPAGAGPEVVSGVWPEEVGAAGEDVVAADVVAGAMPAAAGEPWASGAPSPTGAPGVDCSAQRLRPPGRRTGIA
ncbi:MAG: hypothetical protein WCK58_12330, partial [Chloroflexota bacterium]